MLPFKRILKLGDSGPEVNEIKLFLINHGYGKIYMTDHNTGLVYIGELDSDNDEFTETLQECLNSFKAKTIDAATGIAIAYEQWIQDQYAIQVDGIFDYNTWLLMEYYDRLVAFYDKQIVPDPVEEPLIESAIINPVSKCIEIEKSQLGIHEIGYSNTGIEVNEFQLIGSNGEVKKGGQPWCAYFQQWAWIRTCEALNLEYKNDYSGYTPYLVSWGKQKGICKGGHSGGGHIDRNELEIGDWVFIYSSTRDNACHIVMFIGFDKDGNMITLEGNTNSGGSRDGGSVCKRIRPLHQAWAAVSWKKTYK